MLGDIDSTSCVVIWCSCSTSNILCKDKTRDSSKYPRAKTSPKSKVHLRAWYLEFDFDPPIPCRYLTRLPPHTSKIPPYLNPQATGVRSYFCPMTAAGGSETYETGVTLGFPHVSLKPTSNNKPPFPLHVGRYTRAYVHKMDVSALWPNIVICPCVVVYVRDIRGYRHKLSQWRYATNRLSLIGCLGCSLVDHPNSQESQSRGQCYAMQSLDPQDRQAWTLKVGSLFCDSLVSIESILVVSRLG